MTHDQSIANRLLALISIAAAILVLFTFILFYGNIVIQGYQQISWSFFTQEPIASGREGGISSILVSTIILVVLTISFSLPLSLAAALGLSPYTSNRSSAAAFLRMGISTLAAVPSIVFGLFGSSFFGKTLGFGFSLLSGALTLTCMVLPFLIHHIEVGIRMVAPELKLNVAALGMPETSYVWYFLLPALKPTLLVGLILGLGRALAETAALVFTSGYVDRMPESIFDSGRALSVHIFDLAMNIPGGEGAAYASSLVLLMMILAINFLAQWLSYLFIRR